MDGVTASVFTAIPVNSGSSDYYGRSVPMQDIQALNHSQTFPLSRHSCLGYPRLALCLGKCGLSDSAFVSLKTGSPARRAGLLITVYQHSSSKRTCAGGYRHFPPPGHNRDLKLAFSKPNLSLISTWPCGSVVPDCLWATYRFPAVLCSRVSFRLSVRQAASRVIMRGSTIFLHCKVPYPGARTYYRCLE